MSKSNNEKAYYRPHILQKSKELLGLICQKCGSSKNVVTHHIDGDTRNNNPKNWQRLCGRCHRKLHWEYIKAHGKSLSGIRSGMIGIRMTSGMKKSLEARAAKEERSISEIMRLALRKYLGVSV